MGKYFGTDGFRGEAGITLTADHAYKVGRFLGWYYNSLRERNGDSNPARIVIGKDTRRSSYMFEYSLVAGLTASGADAYLLHVTTTPSVAYIARVDDFDYLRQPQPVLRQWYQADRLLRRENAGGDSAAGRGLH